MIYYLIKMMINSFAQDDVAYVCRLISNSKINRLNRIFFLSNNLLIIFDHNYEICIVKHKTDVVPLFIFEDEDSISKIKKMLLEAK
jgi:hypothetical protein